MSTPRLLLFGPPGAGKSSLVDALAQAAPGCKAEIVDQSSDYQRVNLEKVSGPFSEVTVVDCNGKSALEMLQADEPFANAHPIKKPILDADGVVLVIEVGAPKKQIADDFRQAARWLRALHEYRGQRADIAAMPVYVVLSKCDRLAEKDDTVQSWQKRIDEAKSQYLDNFEKYLKDQHPAFGSIRLKVLATSTKPPVLAEKSAKVKEPIGVAELFRQSVESAADYQERGRRAQGRLQNVVAGLVGMIAILGLSVVFLLEFQPESKATALDEAVQLILPKAEAMAPQRLQGTPTRLEEKLKRLTEIEEHADFARLSSDTRERVTSYRKEMTEYLERYNEAQNVMKLPHLAKNQQELDQQEKNVRAFQLTGEQTHEWADTRLGHLVAKVRNEYKSLHTALDEEEAWIRKETDKTNRLLKDGTRVLNDLVEAQKGSNLKAIDWLRKIE